MADIRFKISGDTPTFIAKLYKNSARGVLLQQKSINYSGTSVVFGNLLPSTSYYITAFDAIGNVSTGVTTTSSVVIGTTSTTWSNKTISMGGTVVNTTNPLESTITSAPSDDNHITVEPPLMSGESVQLVFSIDMQNTSTDPAAIVQNYVKISRKLATSGVYNVIYERTKTTNYIETFQYITLNYGDDVRYEMQTLGSGTYVDISGFNKLSLAVQNSVGFYGSVNPSAPYKRTSIASIPPTTVPPLPPIIVSITQPTQNNVWVPNKTVTSQLMLSRDLMSGESFKINFTDSASVIGSPDLPRSITARSYAYNANTSQTINNVTVTTTHELVVNSNVGSIIVNATNQHNIDFYAIATSAIPNEPYPHEVSASVTLNSISEYIGGSSCSINISSNSISATIQQI